MSKGTIIFIAYHFPPSSTTVAGVRGGNLAFELAKNGWQVKVITPAQKLLLQTDPIGQPVPCHPNLEILETDHDLPELAHWWVKERKGILPKVLGKLGRGFCQLFDLDQSFGWARHVKNVAARFKQGDVNLVLATGSPYISFKLAANIAKKLNCPYVLDYRDPWTSDPHYRVRNPFIIKREKKLLAGASAVVAVSPTWAKELSTHNLTKPAQTITNGYNPDQLSSVNATNFDVPAISYTGRFMPPITSPDSIMKILVTLEKLDPELPWKFHYYGVSANLVEQSVKNFHLEHRVVNHGQVNRQQCLMATKGSVASICVSSDNDHATAQECGIIRGKTFEVMGLGCPIVYIAPPELDVCHIITTTNCGRCFTASSICDIAQHIFELVKHNSHPHSSCEEYSWPVLGKKYSDLLEEVIK